MSNSLIDTLNIWAGRARDFAWPMFWQSSVLIIVVFALEMTLLRKVRAAVRYTLWLVVLLKLVIPTSFAFPTSVAWWWPRHAEPIPAVRSEPSSLVIVPSGYIASASIPTTPAPPTPLPSKKLSLSASAKLLLACSIGTLILLALMLYRWFQISSMVRHACSPLDWLAQLFRAIRSQIRVRWPVRLRLTDEPISPSLCGMLRPVVLLSDSLAVELSQSQLRAVLLHELIHLRRGDVPVSFVQSLLQVIYWWHPLVWFANARIRRLREEAVDDSVMAALDEDAELYPSTLLEIARLTHRRPLGALAFVGILESKSSLRSRIERLANFHKPRRAGLTFFSIAAVLAFAAIAVPMAEPPAKPNAGSIANQDFNVAEEGASSSRVSTSSDREDRDRRMAVYNLVMDGRRLYDDGKQEGSKTKFKEALHLDPQNQVARYYIHLIESKLVDPATGLPLDLLVRTMRVDLESLQTNLQSYLTEDSGNQFRALAELEMPELATKSIIVPEDIFRVLSIFFKSKGVDLRMPGKSMFYSHGEKTLLVRGTQRDIDIVESSIKELQEGNSPTRLNAPIPPRLPDSERRIDQATSERIARIKQLKKIRLYKASLNHPEYASSSHLPLYKVVDYLKEATKDEDPSGKGIDFFLATGPMPIDIRTVSIDVQFWTKKMKIFDILEGITKSGNTPIKYSLEDRGVVFSLGSDQPALFTRTFRLDAFIIRENLSEAALLTESRNPAPEGTLQGAFLEDLRWYLIMQGTTPSNVMYWNEREGTLLVRATSEDLDRIEEILQIINIAVPPKMNQSLTSGANGAASTQWLSAAASSDIVAIKESAHSRTRFYKLREESKLHDSLEKALATRFRGKYLIDYERNLLVATGTTEQLDMLEQVIVEFDGKPRQAPPQINIKATIIKIDDREIANFEDVFAKAKNSVTVSTNHGSSPGIEQVSPEITITGMLSPKQFRALLPAIEQIDSTHLLSEASITTLSSRQTQIQVVTTNMAATKTTTNGVDFHRSIISATLNLFPVVTTNHENIELNVIANFPDYLDFTLVPRDSLVETTDDVSGPLGLEHLVTASGAVPGHIRARLATAKAVVQDGHTLMLLMPPRRTLSATDDLLSENGGISPKHLLIFITPTLIDPAGNPIH